MKERLVTIDLPAVYPGAAAALGANYAYLVVPFDITVVGVSAAPSADDADLTLTINDDGAAAVGPIACAVKATPGTWKASGYGGSETPVKIAAGSKVSFTAADAAHGTQIVGQIWALVGEA